MIYRVLSISTVQQSDPILHTFFFSHSPPSCSLASDWIQFPVLRSRRSADSLVNVAFVNMMRIFHVCFCFCFAFLGPHLWHRARGWISYSVPANATAMATPDPSRGCKLHTTAHGNTGSLTHWARPGIKPVSSWIIGSLQLSHNGNFPLYACYFIFFLNTHKIPWEHN